MSHNRFWRFIRNPAGARLDGVFALESEPAPAPGAGEVLIRVCWLSMDAGTRMWITARTDGYQPPLPPGEKMVGLVVGHVVASMAVGFAPGDLVRGFGQWADYALVDAGRSGLTKLADDVDPRQHLGALGLNAMTAWAGMVEVLKVRAGETVAVSAAAGATGLLACQIARNLGCRVIGIAGGPDKCRYLIETHGVVRAIDYKQADVAAELGREAGGINAYFDNVGGPILDAVLPNMAHYGRIAICGLVSGYDRDAPAPGPARFDQLLMRRLSITGFFLPDFLARAANFLPTLRQWFDAGLLVMPFDEAVGLDQAVAAYERMLSGGNIGKVIVKVAD